MSRGERERMIFDHMGLVHHVVGRISPYLPEDVRYEDLVSAAVLGLIKAVDRYDPSRGARLATYAYSVIRGEVMEALRERDWAPRSVRRKARELARVSAALEYELGRPPTEEELAEALGVSLQSYYRLLQDTSAATLLSLEETLADDEQGVWEPPDLDHTNSFADPAVKFEEEDVRRVLTEAVQRLPEREQQVLGLYYQARLTYKEIGRAVGVTESRVCQIHSQAIARLRGIAVRELALAVAA